MKNYLVTGGAGFIGSNFIKYMLEKYSDIFIVNLDKLTYAGNLNNLKEVENNENYTFVKGDICDQNLVKELFLKYNFDYVVNFAAESHVDRSINSAFPFVQTNIFGTLNLLQIARENWEESEYVFKPNHKFLQVSTDEVYGSLELDNPHMFNENDNIDPHSPYSASKASADLLVKSFADTHKMPVVITRCSNNYGPNQYPEKLIPLIILKCLKKEKLPIYGDGLNVRDWLFVIDHCMAIDLVLHSEKVNEVYNVGGNNEKNNITIVKTIIDYLNKLNPEINYDLIEYVKDRKGHDRRYAIDYSKIKNELGYEPKYDFESAMQKTIDWYLKNQDWLNEIKV